MCDPPFRNGLTVSECSGALLVREDSKTVFESPETHMILIGCKIDTPTDRVITYTDAKEYCVKHNMEYMETSSYKKIGIKELFNHIIISLKNNMDIKLFNS